MFELSERGTLYRFSTRLLLFSLALSTASCAVLRGETTREPEPVDLKNERIGNAFYDHEDMYIVIGQENSHDSGDSKYQISAKARVYRRAFFAYSITNVWNISETSAPLLDTSHRPALFYYGPKKEDATSWWIHTAAGWEHNSNGRGTNGSRSLDTLFYKPTWYSGSVTKPSWRASGKVFGYIGKGRENSDIQDYQTFLTLEIARTVPEKYQVSLRWTPGKGGRGRGDLSFAVPFKNLNWPIPGSFFVNIFSGSGETLLNYDESSKPTIRIGYAFIGGLQKYELDAVPIVAKKGNFHDSSSNDILSPLNGSGSITMLRRDRIDLSQ